MDLAHHELASVFVIIVVVSELLGDFSMIEMAQCIFHAWAGVMAAVLVLLFHQSVSLVGTCGLLSQFTLLESICTPR